MPERRPLRVLVFDLLCVVPYYTGYLCRALREEDAGAARTSVTLASVTYHLDPEWFNRVGVANHAALDGPRWFRPPHHLVRKVWKFGEYFVNLTACAGGLVFRRPDILHVQFFELMLHGLPFELWLMRLARKLGIRIVYTAHDVMPHDGGQVNEETLRRAYHLCHAVIAHDTSAQERLIRDFGVQAASIQVIPHGPLFDEPPGTREQERRRLGVAADTCVVLYHGILRSYKGIPFLLDAWKEVQSRKPNALLRIAGTGSLALRDEVRQKVKELGLEQAVCLDLRFLTVQELRDALDASDVLVYPYREITTSGALMTGINYGKALVATRLPAFEQMLRDEDNALLVAYPDVPALAGALMRLIDDRPLRQRLGHAPRQADRQPVGWPEIARRTLNCYEAVVKGSGSSDPACPD